MNVAMPRKTEQTKTKTSHVPSSQRILERAIEVIEKCGEVGIRTNIIANECGVSPPILYRAFGSREGLIIAAQVERYRRSIARITERLVSRIESSNSREELYTSISESLDGMFSTERIPMRHLRAQVLGSAVSRPELQIAIDAINKEFAQSIAQSYQRALENEWVSPEKPLDHIALWIIGMINSRITIEQGATKDDALGQSWNELTKRHALEAIFGNS